RRHTRSTRDWSSDVCSSDLRNFWLYMAALVLAGVALAALAGAAGTVFAAAERGPQPAPAAQSPALPPATAPVCDPYQVTTQPFRSEERRVGKERNAAEDAYR